MTGPAGGMRASEADRDAAAETLADAVGSGRLTLDQHRARLDALYAAITTDEVAAVVADVPARPVRRGALYRAFDPYRCVVVGGRAPRAGRWRIGRFCSVITVLGRLDLDLRDAAASQDTVSVTVWGLAAHITVIVPAAWGLADQVLVLGRRDTIADNGGSPGAPLLHLRGLVAGGSLRLTEEG